MIAQSGILGRSVVGSTFVVMAAAWSTAVVAAPRKAFGWNSISNAIAFCQEWMEGNGFDGFHKVNDVSGDAGQRGGMPLATLDRDWALICFELKVGGDRLKALQSELVGHGAQAQAVSQLCFA